MTGVLTKDDFQMTRNCLRFLGMGVLISRERASAMLDVVKAVDPQRVALGQIALVAEAAKAGTLPSQNTCHEALDQLKMVQQDAQRQHVREGEGDQGMRNG